MTQQRHPITLPPELAAEWVAEIYGDDPVIPLHPITLRLVERAAQWGADQELETCCKWADQTGWQGAGDSLRAARRPPPPSLKEQAMTDLTAAYNDDKIDDTTYENIRRALEQLPDNE